MTASFRATLRVTGEGRLQDFGERVRWLMVRDIEVERYTEHHGEGVLEYRFELEKGIPFPVFASASLEFPELRVEAEWENPAQGVRGRAVIENGKLVEHSADGAGESAAVDVAVGPEGRLLLAVACRDFAGACVGYAASAERHAYFRYAGGALQVAPEAGERWSDGEPIERRLLAELEDIAFGFAAQWLWYDEGPPEETAFERARYADYGYPVRGANVRSERLARMRREGESPDGGWRYTTLGDAGREARAALDRLWQGDER
jgi:hypothetical protein